MTRNSLCPGPVGTNSATRVIAPPAAGIRARPAVQEEQPDAAQNQQARARARAAAAPPRTPGAMVQTYVIFSVLATAPAGKPMSISTTSPSPRGPSRNVGTWAASVPRPRSSARHVVLGAPAVQSM